MPELLLELFSEEIPARMQARGAEDLARLLSEALAPLSPAAPRAYHAPRRIACVMEVAPGVAERRHSERGPRVSAPEQALAGFLRKHNAAREELRREGDFWVLERAIPGLTAAALIAREIPPLLRRFPWPKSMRWGTSAFTWVRPLRRILCLLDGAVVPFDLRQGEDDAHGLRSGNQTEGHRFLSPDAFAVTSAAQWRDELRRRHVIVDPGERRDLIARGIADAVRGEQLAVVDDPGLLDEVTGLVEWPVPLLGLIGDAFMDLPPEVMQVSMRVNQRYFALRDAHGRAAPRFAFVANIPGAPDAAAIVTGNERVLRARFSDARHFWDLDRQTTLESRVPALDAITFHAKLGSQGDRVRRLEALAGKICSGFPGARPHLVGRAARLCKADLTTGMVGEFPELQGIMGGYYARHDGEDAIVADAIRDHYAPRGGGDQVPTEANAIVVAIADKADQLAAFFGAGEKPTGSGDPFALRRAALGIIRIVRDNGLRLRLRPVFQAAADALSHKPDPDELVAFLFDRLRVQLRAEGSRHDVMAAVLRAEDDDIVLVLHRMAAVTDLLGTEDGTNLITGYRRAANILRIEEAKDGPYDGGYDPERLVEPEEKSLHDALRQQAETTVGMMSRELYSPAMQEFARLRQPIDAFFNRVTVNAPDADLRRTRLGLLAAVRAATAHIADFSKIDA
jgi:glycyl-tRNA synthetase beta chain